MLHATCFVCLVSVCECFVRLQVKCSRDTLWGNISQSRAATVCFTTSSAALPPVVVAFGNWYLCCARPAWQLWQLAASEIDWELAIISGISDNLHCLLLLHCCQGWFRLSHAIDTRVKWGGRGGREKRHKVNVNYINLLFTLHKKLCCELNV